MKSSAPISDGRPLLEFKDVDTYYGELHVLKKVNYEIRAGEIVCLLGGNASGKSTTMKTVLGIVRPSRGTVTYDGIDISKLRTAERVKRGIAPVPEARRLFPKMTVLENLEMGAFTRNDNVGIAEDLERVYALFPRVKERRGQLAGTLSGGEQQMCAIGRALMSDPKLLLLDEPSAGLAPVVVQQVFELIKRIRENGLTVLIVEQNVQQVLHVVDRAYLLEAGTIRASGTSADMLASDTIKQAYLGV